MNILEAEDLVKGLPDQQLLQKAKSPDGQIPQFLYVSEVQRRQDLRKRFQSQGQEGSQGTVSDQILGKGLGSLGGNAPRGTSMPPRSMPGAGSPPHTQSAFPPPVGRPPSPAPSQQMPPQMAQQMPPQRMAQGGVVRMKQGGIVGMQQGGTVMVPIDGRNVEVNWADFGYSNPQDFLAAFNSGGIPSESIMAKAEPRTRMFEGIPGGPKGSPSPAGIAGWDPRGPNVPQENFTPSPAGIAGFNRPPVDQDDWGPNIGGFLRESTLGDVGLSASHRLGSIADYIREWGSDPEKVQAQADLIRQASNWRGEQNDKFADQYIQERLGPPALSATPVADKPVNPAVDVDLAEAAESARKAEEAAGSEQIKGHSPIQVQGTGANPTLADMLNRKANLPDISALVEEQKRDSFGNAMVQLGAGIAGNDLSGGLSNAGIAAFQGRDKARELQQQGELLRYQQEVGDIDRDTDILYKQAVLENENLSNQQRIELAEGRLQHYQIDAQRKADSTAIGIIKEVMSGDEFLAPKERALRILTVLESSPGLLQRNPILQGVATSALMDLQGAGDGQKYTPEQLDALKKYNIR